MRKVYILFINNVFLKSTFFEFFKKSLNNYFKFSTYLMLISYFGGGVFNNDLRLPNIGVLYRENYDIYLLIIVEFITQTE